MFGLNKQDSPGPQPHREWTLPALLFVLALSVYVYALGWGTPNGNNTWAADSIKPGAPLSIMYRIAVSEGWNSGWFWFKYPLGHVIILSLLYAPYLAWLFVSGGISAPSSAYPHGFSDPEQALTTLALIGRSASAVMGAGSVVLVYLCVLRSFGRSAAVAAAVVTALCYPVVFYSHTTNVEMPYLFWMLLALLCAFRLSEDATDRRCWVGLGVGAAMSVSTKELAAGAFVLLPLAIAGIHAWKRRPVSQLIGGGLTAALCFAGTLVLANNIWWNPQGFFNRIGFLTQTLEPETALRYAPYYFPIELGGSRGLAVESTQLMLALKRIVESLSLPGTALAAAGAVLVLRQRPAWAVLLAAFVTGFYLVGVRAMLSLSMRYVLPITVAGAMLAGIALATLAGPGRAALPRRLLAVAALVFLAAYGLDVDRMLAGDGRYGAERWLAANLQPGHRIEVYQRPTYLPRFPPQAEVTMVEFEQRGPAQLVEREPDFIIISSAGISGVSVRYKTDWQSGDSEATVGGEYLPNQVSSSGKVMNYARKQNLELLAGLRDGSLGYEVAGRFVVKSWIERPLIESLNPEITVYRRSAQTAAHQ